MRETSSSTRPQSPVQEFTQENRLSTKPGAVPGHTDVSRFEPGAATHLQVTVKRELAVDLPELRPLTKEEVVSRAKAMATEFELSPEEAAKNLGVLASVKAEHAQKMSAELQVHVAQRQEHMIGLLQDVKAGGLGIVQTLDEMRQEATRQLALIATLQAGGAALAEHGQIVTEEAIGRGDLTAQFHAGKASIEGKEHANRLNHRIQTLVDAQKDSNQKNVLIGLMTISNFAQAYAGGGPILTAIEVILNTGVITVAGRTLVNTLLENPIIQGMRGAASVIGGIRAALGGNRVAPVARSAQAGTGGNSDSKKNR